MIPFLTYPLALIALASIPALAAIYILRHRFRRRQVSSLLLWQFRLQSREGGARVHRLQLPLLFFLELLILLLLVTAATGPNWKLARATRPMIVVLDDSFSMRAGSAGGTAQSRARDALEKLFRFQAPPSTRFIVAGAEPRLLGSPVTTWAEAEARLAQWTCRSSVSMIEAAIALATDLGKQEANILVITDAAPADEIVANSGIQWQAFGRPADNVAIVGASRSQNGDQDRCLLEIANFSKVSRQVPVTVTTDSNAVQRTMLSLAPKERQRLVFNLASSAPLVRAGLENDALPDDNEVLLLPPIRHRVRVRVALTNETLQALVERALDSTGLRAALSESPHLVIHHSATPGGDAWNLQWIVPEEPNAYSGPFMIDGSHPAGEGLSLDGVVWAAAPLTNAPDAVPVILAGNVPLLTAAEDALGRQFLTLNLHPELSTIGSAPDWPALFWNILDWRASQLPGLAERNTRPGATVRLQTTGEPVTVTLPDGTIKSYLRPGNQLALETPLPGVYKVVMGQSTDSFSANLLAADESDLSDRETGTWGEWPVDRERRMEQTPLAWLFGLAALGLLTTHLFLLKLGKGN